MEHISVLLHETVDSLCVKEDGIYVDLTLGRGGHTLEILKKLKSGHVYGFDQDQTAIDETKVRLEEYKEKIVDKLRGMFAFVIWDIKNKEMFGARDPFGIKPFYYTNPLVTALLLQKITKPE